MRTHATLAHPAPLQPTPTPELQVDSDLVPELYNEGALAATPPLQDPAPPSPTAPPVAVTPPVAPHAHQALRSLEQFLWYPM